MTNFEKLAAPAQRSLHSSVSRCLGLSLLWLVVALLTLWLLAVLSTDVRVPAVRVPAWAIYIIALLGSLPTALSNPKDVCKRILWKKRCCSFWLWHFVAGAGKDLQ